MDMSNYRELFLSETREHINTFNQLVVELEKAPENRETVDALFREAHSIKGMAATMGYERTAALAHRLEDFLDGFRSTGEAPSGTIDYLLEGADLLEGLLDDLQAERPEREIDDFLAEGSSVSLNPMDGNHEDDADVPYISIDVTDVGEQEIEASESSDLDNDSSSEEEGLAESDTFQVLVELAENTPAAAARGILILKELEKSGELKTSNPDMDTLRQGGPCKQIQAWVCTSLNKDHLEEALLRISGVTKVHFVDDRRKDDRRQGEEAVRTIRVRTDLLDQFVNLTGELITHRYMLNVASTGRDWKDLDQTLGRAGRLIDDLHHHVLQARLMPLENITGRLPRIVRDLSRKTGKKVVLRMSGTEVGIDRVILEALTDPLVHLIRNAIDHGIEEEGVVTLSARREKDLVLVEVADDGQGMDPDRLRQQAVKKGLLSENQVEILSDRDALMLVCQPGFSTAEQVTETSGRGVGMDVVKEAVNNLGGTLDIISERGSGTRFQMLLPLSVAIIKILLVSCNEQTLAIPITRVLRTLDLPKEEIQMSGHQRAFRLDEDVINLFHLSEELGLSARNTEEIAWVIITEVQGRRVGLQVDRFLGQREAFVKQVGFPLNRINGVSGATVEGNGQVVFIVDPQAMYENRNLFIHDKESESDAI